MTYGIYTPDLNGVSLSGQSLEEAKRYCYGDRVVCSERDVTIGFAVRFVFTKNWDLRIRWSWQYSNFGFIHVSWERLHHLWADKIVWTKEGSDHA